MAVYRYLATFAAQGFIVANAIVERPWALEGYQDVKDIEDRVREITSTPSVILTNIVLLKRYRFKRFVPRRMIVIDRNSNRGA